VLSFHTVLIAAVLVPYVALMGILGFYIYWTGRPPRQEDDGEQDDSLGDLPLAA
jgi:hypothetical protein